MDVNERISLILHPSVAEVSSKASPLYPRRCYRVTSNVSEVQRVQLLRESSCFARVVCRRRGGREVQGWMIDTEDYFTTWLEANSNDQASWTDLRLPLLPNTGSRLTVSSPGNGNQHFLGVVCTISPDKSVLKRRKKICKRSKIIKTIRMLWSVSSWESSAGFREGGYLARGWVCKLTVYAEVKAEVRSLRGAAVVSVW